MDPERLARHIDRFREARIVVIGDIILDQYVWGNVRRISPEAPVPVVEVESESQMLGGAGNVVRNLATLGARPFLCGVVGDDPEGRKVLQDLEALGLSTSAVVVEASRPTSVKTRIVAHHQQVVRFDRETRQPLHTESTRRIIDILGSRLQELDVLVISDYGKGVVTSSLMEGIWEMIRRTGAPRPMLTVDPKTGNFECYKGVTVITPNHHEAGLFCGLELGEEEALLRAGTHMREALGCSAVLITRGKEGMTLFEGNGEVTHIPTVARKVFDVTGAGDTVIGTLSLGLASGLDMKTAALLSNYAAGIVVGEVGTSAVQAQDLKRALQGLPGTNHRP